MQKRTMKRTTVGSCWGLEKCWGHQNRERKGVDRKWEGQQVVALPETSHWVQVAAWYPDLFTGWICKSVPGLLTWFPAPVTFKARLRPRLLVAPLISPCQCTGSYCKVSCPHAISTPMQNTLCLLWGTCPLLTFLKGLPGLTSVIQSQKHKFLLGS